MASRTFLLILAVATLLVAVLGAGYEDDTGALYQMYNEAMAKRDDHNLMDYLLEKRGRGGSTRKCMHQGSMCTCDYRFGPTNSKRYANCLKITA